MSVKTLQDLLPHGYVDAHHHIWAPESRGDEIGYGWLRDIGAPKPFGDPTPIQRDYLMEEFLAESSLRPRASVHVQTDGALRNPVAETRFVQAEADRADHAVKIVALVDLGADGLAQTLSAHAESRDFCGVRQIVARLDDRPDLSFAPRDYLSDSQWVKGLKVLEDRGLTFDLQMYPEQAEAALEALSKTPALTVIIDHALCPYYPKANASEPETLCKFDALKAPMYPSQADYDRWLAAVKLMAARPNTYVKYSGWGMYSRVWADNKGVDPVGSYMLDLLLHFGADRIMWGSNYPVEKLSTSYMAALANTAAYTSKQYRNQIFYQSAATAYGIKLK